jgi:ZIP family zinc transporter
MGVLATLLLTTLIAGVVGTGLGGLIGALLQKDSNRTVSLLLSFAGGVMLAVVCFDLVVEAIETQVGIYTVIGSVAFGVAVIYFLNWLIDRKTNPEVPHIDANHPQTHDDLDELIHADHFQQHRKHQDSKLALFVAGVVMACAIALHNVPEGMTIGASYASSQGVMGRAALTLAILIGLHNIPEGMAVSVPLISGGMTKWKAVCVTAASGIPTVVGAVLGYWLGEIGPMGLCMSLGFASGAMLYVVFGEILPQAIIMYRSKLPAFSAIVGILVGMLIIFA